LVKENVKVEHIVTIEVIDRNTGEVKKKVTSKNTLLNSGALLVLKAFDGTLSSVPSASNIVSLFDPNKTYIKSITGSFGSETDTGSAWQNTVTATDSSTDAYTVQYLQLSSQALSTYSNAVAYFVNAQASAVSKGSADILKVTWTISVSYGSLP
jgi:hypothetical protein